MRMFLVGMCDIFLILYLTSLSQVNPFNNSFLTVDDYNRLKEAKIQADYDSEISKGHVLELKTKVSALDKEKEQALQLILTAKAETEKAMQLVNIEKKKAAQAEIALSKTISKKEELNKLLQKYQEKGQRVLKIVEEMQIETEKAKENEQKALKTAEELRLEAKKKEQFVLKIAEEAKLEAEKAKDNEKDLRRIAREAQLKAEEARKNEEVARRIAEEERLKAEIARESETIALKLAENAENLKEIALKNEAKAKKAEANALKVASVAQSETAEVKTKIKSITQTSDKAYSENILEKLTQFTITIEYESRLEPVSRKAITMQGLPVKMGDDHVIFVPLDRIGLDSSLTPANYISYNITANGKPVTKLYIKPGDAEIAALVINADVKHCLPVGKTNDFSSYMPVLFSIRSQKRLGVMDRIRGISRDFFIFKRDYLLMITEDEFYFDNKGFRGTRNYAEYIVKGDQIVDLEGNFIGFAYKKNKILRIDNLKGWREFSI
ncbi:MAG: hypothetical protein JYX80_13670 [Candidatus Scalindua sediminis]|nr:hypothetical protein [Candidatus Scalindua sediminis]